MAICQLLSSEKTKFLTDLFPIDMMGNISQNYSWKSRILGQKSAFLNCLKAHFMIE